MSYNYSYTYEGIDKLTPVLNKIQNAVSRLDKAVKLLQANLDKNLGSINTKLSSLNKSLASFNGYLGKIKTPAALASLRSEMFHVDSATQKNIASMKRLNAEIRGIPRRLPLSTQALNVGVTRQIPRTQITNTRTGITMPEIAGTVGGVAAAAKITQVTVGFEDLLLELSAITGARGENLDFLKNEAYRLGRKMGTDASGILQAMKLVGSSKPELLKDLPGLSSMAEQVLILKHASKLPDAEAARALAVSLNAFNAPGSKANEFINVLGAGTEFGVAEIPQALEAISIAGGTAYLAGVDFVGFNAMVQTMAKQGQSGSKIGTALNTIIPELVTKLKIDFNKALPSEAIDKVLSTYNSLPETKKPLYLRKLFGREHADLAAALVIYSQNLKDNEKNFPGTRAGEKMAETNMSGVHHAWNKFKGSVAEPFTKMYELVKPDIIAGFSALTKAVYAITDAFAYLYSEYPNVAKFLGLIAGLAAVVSSVAAVGMGFKLAAGLIAAGLARLLAVAGITGGLAIATNPVLLLLTAIAAAMYGVYQAYKALDKAGFFKWLGEKMAPPPMAPAGNLAAIPADLLQLRSVVGSRYFDKFVAPQFPQDGENKVMSPGGLSEGNKTQVEGVRGGRGWLSQMVDNKSTIDLNINVRDPNNVVKGTETRSTGPVKLNPGKNLQ